MPIRNECIETTNVSRIVVEEGGKKATFMNATRRTFRKIRVDNCVVKNATAADYLIEKDGVGALVVELKGSDVAHAITQVVETGQWYRTHVAKEEKLAALIVCNQYPRVSSIVLRGQARFSRLCGGNLTVVSRNREHHFEELLR